MKIFLTSIGHEALSLHPGNTACKLNLYPFVRIVPDEPAGHAGKILSGDKTMNKPESYIGDSSAACSSRFLEDSPAFPCTKQ